MPWGKLTLGGVNRLPQAKRIQVLENLIQGQSIRSIVRTTGVAKNTIVKLLAEVGAACAAFQDQHLRGLPCVRLSCDEVLSFARAQQKDGAVEKQSRRGICHAIALHLMYFNFCRIDQTLRTTPAMAAKVTDRAWELADIVALL